MDTPLTGDRDNTDNSCLYNNRHTLNSNLTTDYNTVTTVYSIVEHGKYHTQYMGSK